MFNFQIGHGVLANYYGVVVAAIPSCYEDSAVIEAQMVFVFGAKISSIKLLNLVTAMAKLII